MMTLLSRFVAGSVGLLGVCVVAAVFSDHSSEWINAVVAWWLCALPGGILLGLAAVVRSPSARQFLLYGGTPFRMFGVLLLGWAYTAGFPQITGADGLLFWRWVIPIYFVLLAWELWLIARHESLDRLAVRDPSSPAPIPCDS